MKTHALVPTLSFLLLLASACKKSTINDLCIPAAQLETLDAKLQANLATELKGYTYLIMKNGQVQRTHSEGDARSPQDGFQPWDEFQKMHIASISKTITTVATLRLLKMKGLSSSDKIYEYLPPDWEIGPNVQDLSFGELMSHRVGFIDKINGAPTLSTEYDGLKTMVANGTNGLNTRQYSNVHHALLRIILPVLLDYPHASASVYDEVSTARRYEQIVKSLVFNPLNIEAELFEDDPNGGVLAYSSASDPDGTFESFDYRLQSGAYGWVLSARDVAKFWAYLWHSDILLDQKQRQEMRDIEMGLWNSGDVKNGRYYCKLGGWFRVKHGAEHWLRSAAVEFPDGTAVVLFTNSPSSRGLRSMIVEAYEESLECF